jgi:hypothetical protein
MNQTNESARKTRLDSAGAGMVATVDDGVLPTFGPIAGRARRSPHRLYPIGQSTNRKRRPRAPWKSS